MKRDSITMAMDAGSARHHDENGFLHVMDNPVTREQVAEYYGHEIPNWEALGLTADRIYRMYRPAEELEKAADTINRLPIYLQHQDVDARHPEKGQIIGTMGSDARFDGTYLRVSLCFIDQTAIELIESRDMVELSLAYFYKPDMTPGTWQGHKYDGIMREIRGNHLALVDEGRAGPSVAVRDSKTKVKEFFMGFWKTRGKAQDEGLDEVEKNEVEAGKKAIEAGEMILSLHRQMPDGTIVDVVEDEDKEAMIRKVVEKVGMEADLEPDQLKKLTDTLTDLAYSKATGDKEACGDMDKSMDAPDEGLETEAEKRAFARGVKFAEELLKKPGERKRLDEEHEREGEERALHERGEDTEAMAQKAADSAMKRVALAYDAMREVQPVLGLLPGFNPARDSAEKLYARALDEMGVKRTGVPDSALRALYLAARDAGTERRGMVQPGRTKDSAPAPEFAHLKNIRVSY